MTCPRCGRPIPADLISCPACLGDKTRTAMRQRHRDYIRAAIAGQCEISLARHPKSVLWHLAQLGSKSAFCGESTIRMVSRWAPASALRTDRICLVCEQEWREIEDSLPRPAAREREAAWS